MPRRVTDILANAGTIILALCLIAIIVSSVQTYQTSSSAADTVDPATYVSNWDDLVAGGNRIGNGNARVRVVVFGDYQCPACAQLDSVLDTLQQRSERAGRAFSLVHRHFPLVQIHTQAFAAALAAECAAEQNSFLTMHRTLYREQQAVSAADWAQLAATASIPDSPEFRKCLRNKSTAARVEEDAQRARILNLPGTPAVVVDGILLPPGANVQRIERMLANS